MCVKINLYLRAGIALLVLLNVLWPEAGFSAQTTRDGIHAPAWAFGQSESRKDRIWQKGIDGDVVSRKKKTGKIRTESKDRLANAARENIKGSLGLSLKEETGSWKTTPDAKSVHPDENIYRDRKHVVRAFADVQAGDDLNISIGPELILKDDQPNEESATENQPDSALGLGMRFKYDF